MIRSARGRLAPAGSLGLLLLSTNAAIGHDGHEIERRFLSGQEDDWEPSVAVGSDGQVIVAATRRFSEGNDSAMRTVVWISEDGGTTFGPGTVAVPGARFQGDARVKADRNGVIHLSWISVETDSSRKRPNLTTSGLVVAT